VTGVQTCALPISTNDLDIETLELLEDLLQDYAGTVLLVSHDREFLNNVVTQTLVAHGDGTWGEYIGGYDDWVHALAYKAPRSEQAKPQDSSTPDSAGQDTPPAQEPRARRRSGSNRITSWEERELAEMP